MATRNPDGIGLKVLHIALKLTNKYCFCARLSFRGIDAGGVGVTGGLFDMQDGVSVSCLSGCGLCCISICCFLIQYK